MRKGLKKEMKRKWKKGDGNREMKKNRRR